VQRRRGFVILGSLVLAGLAALLLGALVLAAMALWHAQDLPPLDKATQYRPQQHLQVLTADGVEIAQYGAERRVFVPIAQTPQQLRQAVLAVEDRQFYEHGGISFRGLARAVVANLSGGVPQGASTITQQVARTFFLSTRRTAERKIKEALLALQLERELSKDQILELYLNQIYLGQRAYGFGAASQQYFGKPLEALSLAETALLAGLPQNPIHANPVASPERAIKRQRWVLSRMVVAGAISAAEAEAALAEPLRFRRPTHTELQAQHAAEMARRAVVDRLGEQAYTEGIRVVTSLRAADQRAAHAAVRRALIARERQQPWRGPEDFEALPPESEVPADQTRIERAIATALREARDDEELRAAIVLAASPGEVRAQLLSGDVVVLTGAALKGEAPRGLAAALTDKTPPAMAVRRGAVIRLQQQPVRAAPARKGASPPAPVAEWRIVQWPQAEAAYVALDPATGRIQALVGGFDFDRQQFNRATSAWRQPGSALKPFLYAAAFEHGVMPETLVNDAPLVGADGEPGRWNPQNSDGRFDGPLSVREGMVRSKNLVSIRLLQQVGLPAASEWVARYGFDAAKQPDNLTFALGAGSTTPLQLALAYAVLANGGHRVEPVLIERIVDAQGAVLFEAPPPVPLTEATRVVPERNVALVNSLLNDVTLRGTGARAQASLKRRDVYGKTGTTNDAVDAWFAGFRPVSHGGIAAHGPGVVAVAWVGFDDPKSLGERETGGGLALPIWIDALAPVLRGLLEQPAPDPAPGLLATGGDWRYEEWAEGGFVERIGLADPAAAGAVEGLPAAAASAPAAASTPQR
jgi:penicillin-binding protein 1A